MTLIAQARGLFAKGRLAEAAQLLGQILRQDRSNADAMQLLGTVQFQMGRRAEGQRLAGEAVKLDPANAEGWNNLGLMRHLSGDAGGALAAFSRATEAHPGFHDGWKNLAFVLQGLARHEEAIAALDRAGDSLDVHFFRANSLAALNRHKWAVHEFDCVIAADPDHIDAWNNRGSSLVALGRPEEGISSIMVAIKRAGRAPLPHCNLAIAMLAAGRPEEALSVIDFVLQWNPDLPQAQEAKERIETELRRIAEQVQRFAALAKDDPGIIQERAELARALQSQGRWRDALSVLAGCNDDGLRVLEALLIPQVFESSDMAAKALNHLDVGLRRLEEQPANLDDPHAQVGLTTFCLPYFGVSDRPYQERIAKLYREAAPSLRFEASHTPGTGSRPRLGVVSAFLTDHSVSRVFGGLIERLDRDRFETVFLQVGAGDPDSERLAHSVDRHVMIEGDLAGVRDQIAREELDLIFYPELSMDQLSYYLSFSRLAPVQCTTWGHPLTSGSPTMDYFISSAHLEREDGQNEYSERLVRLPSLNTFYARPEEPSQLTRVQFGLPEDRRLYGCPQAPFKFHPEYDQVLASILERDDRGVLIMIEPRRPNFKQILLDRWRRSHSILVERTIWLQVMPLNRFLRLLQLCDALLVPIQFGAGRSALDALGVDAPLVTLEGPYLKSRITSAAYKEIGFENLIAKSEEEYVELAIRLANNKDFHRTAVRTVREKAGRLYENQTAVTEFNDFFDHAAKGVD